MKISDGSFDKVSQSNKEFIMKLVGSFHYRNGIRHDDGSIGEIRITPKQLNDCLAFAMEKIASDILNK